MPEEFPHLTLTGVLRGPARLQGFGSANEQATYNRQHRTEHKTRLLEGLAQVEDRGRRTQQERRERGLPPVPAGVPFMVKVTSGEILDFLAAKLGLEVVAEYEDGFVVVSAADLDFTEFRRIAALFESEGWGSAQAADVLAVYDDSTSRARLEHILSESVLNQWPLNEAATYTFEVSIQTAGLGSDIPDRPELRTTETQEDFAARLLNWEAERIRVLQRWEDQRIDREAKLEELVQTYGGKFQTPFVDGPGNAFADFADSFSARITMSGRGFKDLILNFPNVFEVTEPDEFIANPPHGATATTANAFQLQAPAVNAPAVCVIDSGIQENHQLLRPAIDAAHSRCFLPGVAATDVADYVAPGGHGTRVAGAVLYPREVPKTGTAPAICWLQNARILDQNNNIPTALFPPLALRQVITHFRAGARRTRLFNHSIAANIACRQTRMSVWAAEIDRLSHTQDVLIIQAAGNLPVSTNLPSLPGIREHIAAGRNYPAYLTERSSRIANPAQSLQALTVGSIALGVWRDVNRRSFCRTAQEPSGFTRSGLGMWDSIKPEVVEFGGDYAYDGNNPPNLSLPTQVCPELVRSTMHEATPGFARDDIGTSYAAPKVAHIAAQLEALLPHQSSLLYRALIVHSARWPAWTDNTMDHVGVLRLIGYGLPDLGRATQNSQHRVTLVTGETYEITAGDAAVFNVPIPVQMRRPGLESRIRIDVTLSYSAEPRRTRKARTGYLATWLDWIASNRGESEAAFRARVFTSDTAVAGNTANPIQWTLATRINQGTIRGVTRNGGTVQRDWAFIRSYDLPDSFCVAVRGHEGWAGPGMEAKARFVLVVSFEAIDGDMPVYVPVQTEIAARVQAGQTQIPGGIRQPERPL